MDSKQMEENGPVSKKGRERESSEKHYVRESSVTGRWAYIHKEKFTLTAAKRNKKRREERMGGDRVREKCAFVRVRRLEEKVTPEPKNRRILVAGKCQNDILRVIAGQEGERHKTHTQTPKKGQIRLTPASDPYKLDVTQRKKL
ncbi:hypothetical protein DPX16_17049 [Anabarilius grahami]|uniref:Uncharacterized protein n=1 Tax=Anabarilius grahami TaxID=495550 RepID=A0A3N0YBT4_ANAGA|nr:hypothetical protein DPX16_17049 [Anabarilius grahami]